MKNKNLQPTTELFERAMHQRVAAGVLVGSMLLGALTIEHEARNYLREAIARPAFATLQNLERENETARIPVNFAEGQRPQTIGGE
ncbi:MAG TPA: hypothetical protein VLG13_01385 [Patescibacteria group bacterium]|nr:hypothetical protein [Patescibacteria group bacterium]